MRTGNLIFKANHLQNGFQFIGDTVTSWYQSAKNIFSDEAPFYLEVEKESGYQQFQQWCSDLKRTLRVFQEDIEKNAASSILFQEKKILSPFYYQKQLSQFEEKVTAFSTRVQKAKARLRKELEAQPDVAECCFYDDLINYIIVSGGKSKAEENLRALLTYYKNLVEENLYQSIENAIEHFIEMTNAYYQEEENILNPLPDAFVKQIIREINVSFLEACLEKSVKEGKQQESFVTRFSNSIQNTRLALQSGFQTITKPKTLVTIGTAAVLGYLYSISEKEASNNRFGLTIEPTWHGSFYQTTNFISTFTVMYGINIVNGNQLFATPVSMVVSFGSLLQPTIAEPMQTIENKVPTLIKRQGDASRLPIVSTLIYSKLIGNYDVLTQAWDIEVSANLAYVTDIDLGLQIINVSDPSEPTLVGSYLTPGAARGVAISGNFVYVADYTFGLQIIDVSVPSMPILVGNYTTSGNAYSVTVSGNTAYVADNASGLQIIDISTPSAPTLIGNFITTGYAHHVTVSDKFAYVADFGSGLQVIDVNTPSTPNLVGNYNTPDRAWHVTLSRNLAYVADYTSGLQIINVTVPDMPTLVGTYNTPSNAYSVTVSGNVTYVADDNSGLQVIDTNIPSTPTLLGTYNTPGSARRVVVSGNLAYVADVESGLQIIEFDLVPTLLVNTLTVIRGESNVLDGSNLLATDRDHDDNSLTYVIDALENGFFQIRPNETIVTEFSQQQVLNGDIAFVHDGSLMPPAFNVSVSDGVVRTLPVETRIDFLLSSVTGTTEGSTITSSVTTTSITTQGTAGTTNPVVTTIITGGSDTSLTQTSEEHSSGSDEIGFIVALVAGSLALFAGLTALVGYFLFRKYRQNFASSLSNEVELVAEEGSSKASTLEESLSRQTLGKGEYEIVTFLDPEDQEYEQLMDQVGFIDYKDEQNSGKAIIGRGAFGSIFIGKQIKETHRNKLDTKAPFVALKEVQSQEGLQETDAESRIQDKLHHPNILRVLEYVDIKIRKDSTVRYVVLPLMSMDLKTFSEKAALLVRTHFLQLDQLTLFYKLLNSMARDIAQGLSYLHSQKIAHHDLKPANVLIHAKEGSVRISDFGVSKEEGSPEKPAALAVLAPEQVAVARNKKNNVPMQTYNDYLSDVWAFGLLFLKLLINHFPLDLIAWDSMIELFTTEYYEKHLHSVPQNLESAGVPAVTIALLMQCLCIDFKERLNAKQVLEHQAFNGTNVYSSKEGYQAPLVDMFRLFQSNTSQIDSIQFDEERQQHSQDPKYMPTKEEDSYNNNTDRIELSNENLSNLQI